MPNAYFNIGGINDYCQGLEEKLNRTLLPSFRKQIKRELERARKTKERMLAKNPERVLYTVPE